MHYVGMLALIKPMQLLIISLRRSSRYWRRWLPPVSLYSWSVILQYDPCWANGTFDRQNTAAGSSAHTVGAGCADPPVQPPLSGEALDREIRRAGRGGAAQRLGLPMIDLDHFKRSNDTYGHDGGDVVLREAASFPLNNVRAEDLAAADAALYEKPNAGGRDRVVLSGY